MPLTEVFDTLKGRLRGQADAHHTVAHSLDVALVGQLFGSGVGEVENRGGFAGLEVELHFVFIHLVAQFHGELSHGVVGSVAETHRVATARFVDGTRQRGPFHLEAAAVGLLLLAEFQGHQLA